MHFKLVRTDTTEPCKIQLPLGKHLIGRGMFLECGDKRVSRNHGELEVTGDTIIVKALHQNPCFIIKKGIEETQILKQNCSINIGNGDRFGLLPDSYWYEILYCAVADVEKSTTVFNNNENVNDAETLSYNSGDLEESQELNVNMNETVNDRLSDSPSLLPPVDEILTSETTSNPTNVDQENVTANTSEKRSCSTSDNNDCNAVKKIKTEVKEEEDQAQAGPSNDPVASPSNKDERMKSDEEPPASKPTLRERCIYGTNCYRRNPAHLASFSHPTDSDYGTGPQGQCPYGASCRRRDPRHWTTHSHPPGTLQPDQAARRNPGKRRRQETKSLSSDSDECDASSPPVIVDGKRARKIVNLNWEDSTSEEEDPFRTDEDSDEWQPSQKKK